MILTSTDSEKELSRPQVYLCLYGRMHRVTALATSMDEGNAYMSKQGGVEGLLAEVQGFCFITDTADQGDAGLTDIARAYVTALANASPEQLTETARRLDDLGTCNGVSARERRIARLIAPHVHTLRK